MNDIFDRPHSPRNNVSDKGYGSEGGIDTEPLPHSPQESPRRTVQTPALNEGTPFPAVVQGSPRAGSYDQQPQYIPQQVGYGTPTPQNNAPSPMTMWGANLSMPERPRRPLSGYNLFFTLERQRIINSDEKDRDQVVQYTVEDVARVALEQIKKAKENKPKEKRSHRRTHGKISFGDLARTIANKWKKLNSDEKSIFEGSAEIEKERYRKELAEWTKQQKKWKEATAKMASAMNSRPHPMYDGYSVVTPTLPKKAVVSPTNETANNVLATNVMATMMSRKQMMDDNRSQSSGRVQARRVSAGPYEASLSQQPYLMAGMGMDAYDSIYTDDEYMLNGASPNDTGNFDYEDQAVDEAYRMAQMTLPRPSARDAFQRRLMLNQRRMRMMVLQQQQQQQRQMAANRPNLMRQQMLLMRQMENPAFELQFGNDQFASAIEGGSADHTLGFNGGSAVDSLHPQYMGAGAASQEALYQQQGLIDNSRDVLFHRRSMEGEDPFTMHPGFDDRA